MIRVFTFFLFFLCIYIFLCVCVLFLFLGFLIFPSWINESPGTYPHFFHWNNVLTFVDSTFAAFSRNVSPANSRVWRYCDNIQCSRELECDIGGEEEKRRTTPFASSDAYGGQSSWPQFSFAGGTILDGSPHRHRIFNWLILPIKLVFILPTSEGWQTKSTHLVLFNVRAGAQTQDHKIFRQPP